MQTLILLGGLFRLLSSLRPIVCCLVSLQLHVGVGAPTASASSFGTLQDPLEISCGESAEVAIRAADSQRFAVVCPDARRVHLAIRQQGIDIHGQWRGADGSSGVFGDALGRESVEHVLLPSNRSMVDLSSQRGVAHGTVQIFVADLEDSLLSRALENWTSALERKRVGELEVGAFEAIAAQAVSQGQLHLSAQAAYAAGLVAFSEGRAEDAVDLLLIAAQRLRAEDEFALEAWVHGDLGVVLGELGETEAASEALEQAERLHQMADSVFGALVARNNRCLADQELGRLRRAKSCYEAVLAELPEVESRLSADVANNLGGVYYQLGEPELAIEVHRQALRLRRELNDLRGVSQSLNNLGLVHRNSGELAQSLSSYQEALEVALRSPSPLPAAIARLNLARLRLLVGDLGVAGKLLEQVRSVAVRGRLSLALELAQAELSLRRGETQTAIEASRKALEEATRRGVPEAVAASLNVLALGLIEKGQPSEVPALVRNTWPAVGPDRLLQGALAGIEAEALVASEKWSLALASAAQAEVLLADSGDVTRRATVAMSEAFAHRGLGDPDAARRAAQRALDLIEWVAQSTASGNLYAWWWQRHGSVAELLIDLEQVGSESLDPHRFWELIRFRAEPRTLRLEDEVTRRLLARLHLNLALLEARSDQATVLAASRRLADLTNQLDAQAAASVGRSAKTSLLDLQGSLREEETYTVFANSRERVWVLVIDRRSARLVDLGRRGLVETQLSRLDGFLGGMSSVPDESIAALVELGRLLLGPIAHRLSAKTLIVAAGGPLGRVPFAALGDPRTKGYKPLVERLAVTRAVWPVGNDQPVGNPQMGTPRTVAFVGNPSYPDIRGDLPQLIAAAEEADFLRRVTASEEVVIREGSRATREALAEDEVRTSRILHIAVHSASRVGGTELSSLYLTGSTSAERAEGAPALVSDYEIERIGFANELVLLSACSSNAGRLGLGGAYGAARAFLRSGAQRVVAAAWQVQDQVAARLTRDLIHLVLKGTSPAQALRQAQLNLRADPRFNHPLHWAGFVLIGDWRPLEPPIVRTSSRV